MSLRAEMFGSSLRIMEGEYGVEFRANSRFEVRRQLGEGAMGIVYEALDRERGAVVAIKLLRRMSGDLLYRFKNEFRAVSELRHPNLVRLGELFEERGQWFFSMELVQGKHFVRRLRPPSVAVGDACPDEAKLRRALGGLVDGLGALHESGHVHRDVKPPNVVIAEDERVVLLDFGLAAALEAGHTGSLHDLVGTPAYMAPEQADGQPVSIASDWYSVGVLLYEALTGGLPFAGSALEILTEKQRRVPPRPREIVPSVPPDLDALCSDLLQRLPGERPSAAEITRRLGRRAVCAESNVERVSRGRAHPFVGRREQIEELERAFSDVAQKRHVCVCLHGSSGLGKTALVREFLRRAGQHPDTLVLSGRCHERESVPFKAFDALLDALSRYLRSMPISEVRALMPDDIAALACAFPVLSRVESVANRVWPERPSYGPQEVRRRAGTALRDLLHSIAEKKRLVVHVDDLQWGGADSAALLTAVLAAPVPPPALFIFSFRSEGSRENLLLQRLLGLSRLLGEAGDTRVIALEPLAAREARRLARQLLSSSQLGDERLADQIASESGGDPYLIRELVHHVQRGGGGGLSRTVDAVSLDDAIQARVSSLPPPARELLETISVAGRPISQGVVAATAPPDVDPYDHLDLLRSGLLTRSQGVHADDAVECYHNRIRDAVVQALSADVLAVRHRGLAAVLAQAEDPDDDALFMHFRDANEPARAAFHAARAAAKAFDGLAFERAAELYRFALEHRDVGDAATAEPSLWRALGDALACAGRGSEAADAYQRAATLACEAEKLELQRRAAEQLLFSGRVDEGLSAAEPVLRSLRMSLSRSSSGALVAFLLTRLRRRLRGNRFRERDESQVDPEDLLRIDVCWSVGAGLAAIDPIRAAVFQNEQQRLALRVGEPSRIAIALALESAFVATGGGPAQKRADELRAVAEQLAERIEDPLPRGVSAFAAAWGAYLQGRWRVAKEQSGRAISLLRSARDVGMYALANSQLCLMWSFYYLGELGALARHVPSLIDEGESRGDLYLATNLRTGNANAAWLGVDDPRGARRAVELARERWSRVRYSVQHYDNMFALSQADLYEGDGRAAWQRLSAGWQALRRSLILRVQTVRIEAWHLRARAALALASQLLPDSSERAVLLRAAERDARRIRREREGWANPLSLLLRAGVVHLRGDDGEAAAELLSRAEREFEERDMALFAAASRYCWAGLAGDNQGLRAADEATRDMRARGVVCPERMVRMLVPGVVP